VFPTHEYGVRIAEPNQRGRDLAREDSICKRRRVEGPTLQKGSNFVQLFHVIIRKQEKEDFCAKKISEKRDPIS